MAKAIFHRAFHYTSRKHNVGWSAYPKPEPQHFPREFIEAAVKAGCAETVVGINLHGVRKRAKVSDIPAHKQGTDRP